MSLAAHQQIHGTNSKLFKMPLQPERPIAILSTCSRVSAQVGNVVVMFVVSIEGDFTLQYSAASSRTRPQLATYIFLR